MICKALDFEDKLERLDGNRSPRVINGTKAYPFKPAKLQHDFVRHEHADSSLDAQNDIRI